LNHTFAACDVTSVANYRMQLRYLNPR